VLVRRSSAQSSYSRHLLQELLDEQRQATQASQLDVERQRQRNEVLTEEYHRVQNKAEQSTSRLEGRVRELEDSLRTYAALEGELDDVIMQAAEADDADQVWEMGQRVGVGGRHVF
jgi:hypothetical protein